MPLRLSTAQADFASAFSRLLAAREESGQSVASAVSEIIARVKSQGDAALFSLTKQFDGFDATAGTIRVSAQETAQALALCAPELMASLKAAASRIRAYSEKQLPENLDYTDAQGVKLGHRWTPLDAVGLYVPGGMAAYPSSVLMNAVPAKVAGVKRLAITVPAPEGKINPAVLAAAHVAGVDEIYKIGGAQAVAALAYGTETIAPVDKIVGPGNAYVAEAKRQVFGKVGIDMIAGPSEILVIADCDNNPSWVSSDLLSQAEHDTQAQSILITDDSAFADAVAQEAARILKDLPRRDIAHVSWETFGAIIVVKNWQEACEISNAIAPEHLELLVKNPAVLLENLRHAGAIFIGAHTPEAIGDYVAGPSHVLPTSGTARFSSGLSVFDFLKRTSLISCSADAFKQVAPFAATLADAEGLGAHALSLRIRTNS